MRCFEKALEVEPGYATAWKNRGLTLKALGRLEEAEESMKKALDLGLS